MNADTLVVIHTTTGGDVAWVAGLAGFLVSLLASAIRAKGKQP